MQIENLNGKRPEGRRVTNRSLIVTAGLLVPTLLAAACGASSKGGEVNNAPQPVQTENRLSTEADSITSVPENTTDNGGYPSEVIRAEVGQQAPDFEAFRINGEPYRLSQNFGKRPVYIYFSTLTDDLQAQFKIGFELRKMFTKDQLEIIFITIAGETKVDTQEFTVLNGLDNSWSIGEMYGHWVPNDYFLDVDGKSVAQREGLTTGAAFDISRILVESQDPALAIADFKNLPFALDPQLSPESGMDYESRVKLIIDPISSLSSDILIGSINTSGQNDERVLQWLNSIRGSLKDSLGHQRDFSTSRLLSPGTYTDSLIEAGRTALEAYCLTNNPNFQSITESIGSLAYYEIAEQVNMGVFDQNKWELEQNNRHFDASVTCNSALIGLYSPAER